MALIKCPECGKEVSDRASVCIGCGFPISEYVKEPQECLKKAAQEDPKEIDERKNDEIKKAKAPEQLGELNKSTDNVAQKTSKNIYGNLLKKILSAITWMIIGFFAFMAIGALISHGVKGFPSCAMFALAALFVSPLMKHLPFNKYIIVVLKLVLGLTFFVLAISNLPKATEVIGEDVIFEESENIEASEHIVEEKEEIKSALENAEEIPENIEESKENLPEEKEVVEDDVMPNETAVEIESIETAEVVEETAIEEVEEIVQPESNEIIEEGEGEEVAEARSGVDYREIVISQREEFLSESVTPTYDELRRYPDTYKDKRLKLKLKIKSVEPDGWVFQGDIIATYGGSNSEIAIRDNRAVREPRFLDGDTITVYALGDGLGTMKVKSKSGIFTKTVDEYEVPCIEVVYTELDNIDSLVTNYIEELNNAEETQAEDSQQSSRRNNNRNSDSESEYYEAGEELGQELIDAMNGIDHENNYNDAKEAGRKAAEYLNSLIGSDKD